MQTELDNLSVKSEVKLTWSEYQKKHNFKETNYSVSDVGELFERNHDKYRQYCIERLRIFLDWRYAEVRTDYFRGNRSKQK